MPKQRSKHRPGRSIWLTLFGLIGLGLFIAVLLRGTDVALFRPKGEIARAELNLILFTVGFGLAIVIPTLIVLYSIAWKYRETNETATYDPRTRQSKLLVFIMWAIPSVFVLVLASVMWPATHKLEPQKLIAADAKPLTVQVVAMRWKWLFIYPEQNIATVNFVQVPVGTPVQFELTADETPMSSFWIPHLGGQLYAMTGHVNRLNLIAQKAGDYPGSTAEINGPGFAGMKFTTRATSPEDFNVWVQDTKRSATTLDSAAYNTLLKPSENTPAAFYSWVEPDLYAKMLMKYTGSHDHQPAKYETKH